MAHSVFPSKACPVHHTLGAAPSVPVSVLTGALPSHLVCLMPVIHGQGKAEENGAPRGTPRVDDKARMELSLLSFDFPLITIGEELRTIES